MSVDAKKKMVTLTINDKPVEVQKGTTILEASRANGFDIPTLCYLKKLKPIGSCRLCSVELEGVASPVMSCETPAAQGMNVTTDSESLKKYRQDMMRMILVEHPRDCPVCERSGECSLQDRTFELNVLGHKWTTQGHTRKPIVDWGLIKYDQNLCIMCERCIKVCREVQGVAAYKIDGTGYKSKINTVTGEKLDCDFCGQCISVCPVGALSSGIGFAGRAWEMKRTATICPHCGVGCTLDINVKKDKVIRVTSNHKAGINDGNLCARGRFGYQFIQSDERVTAPLIKSDAGMENAKWNDALEAVAQKLKSYKDKFGGKAFVGIGSERSTNEDNYVFQKFFREVLGSGNLDNVANMNNGDICSKAFETFGDVSLTASYESFDSADLFVLIGADGSVENPVVGNLIRRATINHGADTAIAYSRKAVFLPEPKVALTYDYKDMNSFMLNLLGRTIENGGYDVDSAFTKSVGKGSADLAIDELVAFTKKRGNPIYIVGQEAQKHPQANAIIRNIANLAKICGGKVLMLKEYCNTQGVNDIGVSPNVLPGRKPEYRPELICGSSVIDQMKSGTAKVLIVFDEDVLGRLSGSESFRDACGNVEYIVVVDQFKSETAKLADVFLASSTSAEKDGTFTDMEGRCQAVFRAVSPIGKPAWQIFTELASKLGKDFGFKSVADIQAEIAKDVPLYSGIASGDFLVDYGPLLKSSSELKLVEPAKVEGELNPSYDQSLFSLGLYTDYCPALKPYQGGKAQ